MIWLVLMLLTCNLKSITFTHPRLDPHYPPDYFPLKKIVNFCSKSALEFFSSFLFTPKSTLEKWNSKWFEPSNKPILLKLKRHCNHKSVLIIWKLLRVKFFAATRVEVWLHEDFDPSSSWRVKPTTRFTTIVIKANGALWANLETLKEWTVDKFLKINYTDEICGNETRSNK